MSVLASPRKTESFRYRNHRIFPGAYRGVGAWFRPGSTVDSSFARFGRGRSFMVSAGLFFFMDGPEGQKPRGIESFFALSQEFERVASRCYVKVTREKSFGTRFVMGRRPHTSSLRKVSEAPQQDNRPHQ
jgi:hypothetical protein